MLLHFYNFCSTPYGPQDPEVALHRSLIIIITCQDEQHTNKGWGPDHENLLGGKIDARNQNLGQIGFCVQVMCILDYCMMLFLLGVFSS